MALIIRYIITNAGNGLYYNGSKVTPFFTMWLHRIPKEVIFKTYEEAEALIPTLPIDNFYQIEKIYKV